jgi:hypothetical protein
MTQAQDTPFGRPMRRRCALAMLALVATLPVAGGAQARPRPAAPAPVTRPAAAPTPPAAAPVVPLDTATALPAAVPAGGAGRLRPARAAELRAAPGGRVLGQLGPGALMTPLARERGWVRVRVDAWVRERDLLPADTALRAGLSAADLRADPDGVRGMVVRWDVEVLAFQRADALRRDLEVGEPYLLARGPIGENALLYLALPAGLVDEARAIAPLTTMRITARVRTGRATPTNVPILDVESLARP